MLNSCFQLLNSRALEGERVIQLRRQQPNLWEGLFAKEVAELWEPWMEVVDELLEDEELVNSVYKAQGDRHQQSRRLGRPQTPAEVALRMLILTHVRNWSYETLEREVRANVVYRSFCRIGTEKVPDAKTLVRLGQAIGPETLREPCNINVVKLMVLPRGTTLTVWCIKRSSIRWVMRLHERSRSNRGLAPNA
jgi:hypothetical protein